MNKKKVFIVLGVFWAVMLAGFIGYKEYTVRAGTEVLLETVPVDPRDLFRGDYVVLRYRISMIDLSKFSMTSDDFRAGDAIFVALQLDSAGIGTVQGISKKKPDIGLFIKGTIKDVRGANIFVEYGIESYFVPEGKGRDIERNRQNLLINVAIDRFGRAIVRSLVEK